MATPTKKLVVCGGNGFLGSRICKYAVARGWDVTSIRYVELLAVSASAFLVRVGHQSLFRHESKIFSPEKHDCDMR